MLNSRRLLHLVALLLAADPPACTRFERLEKQLAAIRTPLDSQGELMLRALTTVEPAALDELYAAKQAARPRLVAFVASLARDSDLRFLVETTTLAFLDSELERLDQVRRVFTPERIAAAKKQKPAEWERLFTKDESTLRDALSTLQSHASTSGYAEPVIGWFGLGLTAPDVQCPAGKSAVMLLFDSAQIAPGPGWFLLAEGLDLEALAKLTAKVAAVRETSVTVGCGPIRKVPQLRYDAATRIVEYDWLVHEKCLPEKLKGALSINMPDHGAGSASSRPPPPRIPPADWAALRAKLLK